jgi:molybdenum cofactor biosynthesis enzyme MoaA
VTVHLPITTEPARGPVLPFAGLDVLWIQIAGTVCNIACTHCFISCGPKNERHRLMETVEVLALLERAAELGVKEYYFTGGEPFLHPDILPISEATLRKGPLSILTNALLIDEAMARALGHLSRASDYSFDLRVSLDGTSAEENDPIRGRGTFDRVVQAARWLTFAGIDPVFTVTSVHARYHGDEGATRFIEWLRESGFRRPRLKLIPPFRIGREARRAGGYDRDAVLREGDLFEGEEEILQCGTCRTVTSEGVYPCPILIEEPGARMASQLEDALSPVRLSHPACVTCHVEGFSCRT